MRFYRVYLLDRVGGILDTKIVEAVDDTEALRKARRAGQGHDVEVWDMTRLVGQTWRAADDDPMSTSAALSGGSAACLQSSHA